MTFTRVKACRKRVVRDDAIWNIRDIYGHV